MTNNDRNFPFGLSLKPLQAHSVAVITRPHVYALVEERVQRRDLLRQVEATASIRVTEADPELLRRFVSEQNEAAFEALMHRHGSMVMGVCRRVLDDPQYAEDAFQTTFLLLVQKRTALKNPDRLGSWLHGVAYRIAARIRAKTAQRAKREMETRNTPPQDPTVEVAWQELRSVLDEEINRLPEKHRTPLILCYLEGKTNAEAAHELGWPKGSISGRLAKAREVLRRRLVRRGMTFSAPFIAMLLAEKALGGTLPTTLVRHTMRGSCQFSRKAECSS